MVAIDDEVADEDDDEVANRGDNDDEFVDKSITWYLKILTKAIKHKKMFGLLIEVEDCFIRREVMSKK